MLNTLYKKLNVMFVLSIMIIITLILIFFSIYNLKTERMNESTFFQRMSMLLNYQIENGSQDFMTTLKEFEKKYDIYIYLQNEKNDIIYESSIDYATDISMLIDQLNQQAELKELTNYHDNKTTTQGGIFELKGSSNDTYFAIPSKIVSKNNNTYYVSLIDRQPSNFKLISMQSFTYICIWFISLLGVNIVCRLLLKKALEPTQLALKSQKDFIASASHELKNPLSILLANVEKIEHLNIDHPQLHTSLRVMDSECIRMSKLIQDMLLLASSDSKTWILKKENIDIDSILINLYESYDSLCMQKGVKLNINISNISFPNLYTDKDRLFQILCIFMDNAITHSHNNTNIDLHTEVTSKYITFFIIDHGLGVSKQDQPYIFDRFYCSDKSHNNKSNVGLGLSIANELAKMLNGNVGFKDTPGGGATFYVSLSII